ncbi:MAG: hypothetical protein ABI763_10455, partial [Bacteroidota bacterium]
QFKFSRIGTKAQSGTAINWSLRMTILKVTGSKPKMNAKHFSFIYSLGTGKAIFQTFEYPLIRHSVSNRLLLIKAQAPSGLRTEKIK